MGHIIQNFDLFEQTYIYLHLDGQTFSNTYFWDVEPTTISPAVSANWASSLSDSSMPKEYSMSPLSSTATRYAFSSKTWKYYYLSN